MTQKADEKLRAILGVVVTYFPDDGFEQRIQKILSQIDQVLVIDNTPDATTPRPITRIAQLKNVSLIRSGSNMGIASALNKGLQIAKTYNYSWVATFDQDSEIPLNYRETFLRILAGHPKRALIGILAPVYRLPNGYIKTFSSKKYKPDAFGVKEVGLTMTSGNLINVSKIFQVGLFDDSLFMDYVDFDLCIRLKERGYLILETSEVVLHHTLGEQNRQKKFIWTSLGVTSYPPARIYYATRNRLILYSRYWKTSPSFVIHDSIKFPVYLLKIILFEKDKKKKLVGFIEGMKDAFLCRLGPKKNE